MRKPRASILMYHRVSETSAEVEEGDYALPTSLFEAQMHLLKEEGRSVVSLTALASGLYPDRSVVLTFDDGCETDATVAVPLLLSLGFPAAFFVNSALVGRPGRATWDQLRATAAAGFLIGSHGLDHTLFDTLGPPELQRQIVESKHRLEEGLNARVEVLALPGGSGGERARRIAQAAGYRLVLGSRPAPLHGPAGPVVLPRFAIRRGHDLPRFRTLLAPRLPFLIAQAWRFRAVQTLRSLLGARAYGRLRRSLLERSTRPGRP